MKIAFCSGDWSLSGTRDQNDEPLPGGAGWYRCRIPAVALERAGHEVVHTGGCVTAQDGALCPVNWRGEVLTGFDVIVIQRWAHSEAAESIRRARSLGQVIVQDIDDWFGGLHPSNGAFLDSHPRSEHHKAGRNRQAVRAALGPAGAKAANDERSAKNYMASLAAADLITASTPYLASRLRERSGMPEVVVLRNAIDLANWAPRALEAHPEVPVVGWAGAVPWRSGDLETLRGVLGPFVERHNLTVAHVGNMHNSTGAFAAATGVDPGRVLEYPILPVDRWSEAFTRFDIGLVPLNDLPFNHSKSAIKGMEHSAAGVPFIAAGTPEYQWYCQGWSATAKKPTHWLNQLERLLDVDQRRERAALARARVEKEDIAVRYPEWVDAYAYAMAKAWAA